ncbi:MAG TPA: ABC transporter permease [Aggregatilinea sp.]|uniref:ABC transporter permease n=1 Tax=Aggregatilinea sp. TaxID=2806333 RepID=UPI002B7374BC|nr:FtsX-like permease family protein [Aggregatilinea sp.]HML23964.1 ABC transporter permease [Aggregatilinea sp.]
MIEKLRFYLRHSLNDLRVNGQRTVFALLCIAAGVAAIVSLQVLGVMIEDTLTGSLQESNKSDIRVYLPEGGTEGSTRDRGEQEGVIASSGAFGQHLFPPSGIAQIREWLDTRYPGQVELTYRQAMTSVTSGISINAPAKDTNQSVVMPYLVDTQVYPFYGHIETEDGLSLADAIKAPTDIVLSRNLADELDVQVGDVVRVAGASEDFTVRGIVPTSAESAMENPLNALFGYYYLDQDAVDLFSDIEPGGDVLYLRLQDPSRAEEINDAFDKRFPYLSTTTTGDLEELNSQISDILGQTVIIMGLISLLIGGIGIVNTMLVIVRRRTTEVAVLKTIGLEGEQITMLFLVEAIVMGIAGSLIGIVLGWIAALILKSGGETLLGQELSFRFTLTPPVTGLVVGVIVTAIFGLMPTLAAGQVRPNLVLRPTDSVMPKAGRARTFAAILLVMLALSIVAQVLVRDLLDVGSTVGEVYDTALEQMDNPPEETEIPDSIRDIRIFNLTTGLLGVFLGEVFALTLLSGGLLSGWARKHLLLRIFRWLLFPVLFPIVGFIFGYAVPAMLLLFVTFVLVGLLYVLLWAIIWFVGHFLPTGPFVDLKLAMRSMLAAKGREASTLLALVVGVFTLSLVTMLAGTVTKFFNNVLEQEIGGNVIVIAAGSGVVDQIDTRLANLDGVNSYAVVGNYQTDLVSMEDVSTGETLTVDQLKRRAENEVGSQEADYFDYAMQMISGRELDSNLPDLTFYKGRQLAPMLDAGKPVMVIPANSATLAAGIDVGDKLTFRVGGSEGSPLTGGSSQAREITLEVVGMTDRTSGQVEVSFGASSYAPIDAFGDMAPSAVFSIVDVDDAQIGALRRSLTEVPGVFVLETSLINDLINSLIDQFTALPILVAALALFTGGVVIANSVALTTLERRREIGIMKAVGLQRERVLGMLLMEYGLMGLIGGLIGILIGGVSLLYLLVRTFGGQLGEVIPYGTAFALMGLCVAIALVAAIVTAWGASGEKPLNVLRYE